MAVALIGVVGPFNEQEEEFDAYNARLESFFIANDITDKTKKVHSFLAVIGPKLYSLVETLMAPSKPATCDYDNIVKTLKEHYSPKVLVIYERFKFYKRNQEVGENIAQYVAGLKSLARTCEFQTNLKEQLRDRFVVGLRDEATQRTLLTEKDLTFDKAVELATAREAAAKDSKEMGRPLNINYSNYSKSKFNPKEKMKPNHNKSKPTKSLPKSPCNGCGGNHWKSDCPYKDAECFGCGMKGHLKSKCLKKGTKQAKKEQNYNVSSEQSNSSEYEQYIYANSSNNSQDPIKIAVELDGVLSEMELDTGASKSLISKSTYYGLWNKSKRPKMEHCADNLRVYGGSALPILGEIVVELRHLSTGKIVQAKLIVIDKDGPTLLGRDILSKLDILPRDINNIQNKDDKFKNDLKNQFPKLFSTGLGTYKDQKFSLEIDEEVKPVYCKPRTVPYTLRQKVDDELDRLVTENVITPRKYSRWAAPIVPVLKPDGSVRICGDYKLTANKATVLDRYPIPKLEDLFSSLSGGKIFTKLDMSQAYAQLELDENSKDVTVINTTKGLFQYNRLCFGIASAPGIFQRAMEQLLRDIPGVLCYLDDILISASNEDQHLARVKQVLGRLEDAGLKLRLDKCAFKVRQVAYLGYVIDSTGIHPCGDKVKAIVDAPVPANVKQLQSYLGIFNFYRRFVPNISSVLEPLNKLLRKDARWHWGDEQEGAFKKSKSLLLNSKALTHFSPEIPLTVIADSSNYGVGAVLCHNIDGQEHPICFASRTLNQAEKNYPQLEKEALAIIFALKKFHNYLWGQQEITVVTDHKPLLGIFSPNKAIPTMSTGRIQRWALMMQSYKIKLVHRSGLLLGTADALSRLPLPEKEETVPIPQEWCNLINFLDSAPVTSWDIRQASRCDPIISRVLKYCENGWPETLNETQLDLLPFFRKRTELTTHNGCLLWGYRVIVPSKLRDPILADLHGGHTGISRMKELARSYVWWPNLDSDLETITKKCSNCLEHAKNPPRAGLHPWEWPSQPWHRLHVDYAGPVQGKYFLVVVDSYSKWVEIFPTNGLTSRETIQKLRHLFCSFGFPITLVSDNGPCFSSKEFKDFIQNNGIRHVTSAPYKPSTNGLAERMIQTFKLALSKSKEHWGSFLDSFLFKYRISPHATTGISPAEMLFKRRFRCRLDLLNPEDGIGSRVSAKQEAQKRSYTDAPRHVEFDPNAPIMVRNYAMGPKWIPAHVEDRTGPLSYKCRLTDGSITRKHQDQILIREPVVETPLLPEPPVTPSVEAPPPVVTQSQIPPPVVPPPLVPTVSPDPGVVSQPTLRRSARSVKPPSKLNL